MSSDSAARARVFAGSRPALLTSIPPCSRARIHRRSRRLNWIGRGRAQPKMRRPLPDSLSVAPQHCKKQLRWPIPIAPCNLLMLRHHLPSWTPLRPSLKELPWASLPILPPYPTESLRRSPAPRTGTVRRRSCERLLPVVPPIAVMRGLTAAMRATTIGLGPGEHRQDAKRLASLCARFRCIQRVSRLRAAPGLA